jgi:hypothetical protein
MYEHCMSNVYRYCIHIHVEHITVLTCSFRLLPMKGIPVRCIAFLASSGVLKVANAYFALTLSAISGSPGPV